MLGLVAITFFLAVLMMGAALSMTLGERSEARVALRTRLGRQAGVAEENEEVTLLLDRRLSSIQILNDLLQRSGIVKGLALMMRQAGMRRRVGEVILYIPLLGSIGVLVGMVLTDNAIIAFGIGLAGLAIPLMIVDRMRKKRLRQFSEQLPDALDLTKAALQAGHSFLTALKVVAEDFPDPVAVEFDTVAEEIRHGLPLREALMGLRERVPDDNVPMLVVGVLVVQESGGNLVEVLDNVTHTVRERFKLLRDVETMTAQGRLSGMLLTSLPFVVSLLLYSIVPDYFEPVLTTETGHWMIGYCIASIIIGHLIIQRLVKIKV